MATRTPKGTATTKASGTTLTISDVSVNAGDSLVVGVGCENGQGAPTTVTHNGRELRRKRQRDNATDGIHSSIWLKGEYHKGQSGDIVATWSSAIGKRAMFASCFDRAQKFDKGAGKIDTPETTNPATGKTTDLVAAGALVVGVEYQIETIGSTDFTAIGAASNTVDLLFVATGVGSGTGDAREALADDGFAVACFVSEGPGTDHGSATARIEDDDVFAAATVGQIAGTTGAPPASNVTVVEAFLELSARKPSRGDLQSATSRVWANVLAIFTQRATINRQGITPSDIIEVDDLVVAAGGNTDDVYYGFNEDTGEWEAYETTTPGALRGTRNNQTGDWETP